jgi:hypothetical protein
LSRVPAGPWPFPTLSLPSLWRCLDPYPAVFVRCLCPSLPQRQRPHVTRNTFGTRENPCKATSTGSAVSGLQSFADVQAPPLARPPDRSHRRPQTGRPGRVHHASPQGLPTSGCGIATCLIWATDMAGLAPARWQPCRLLRRDRNVARATVGGEFPVCTLSVVQRVPSSTMVHVSTSPPMIPDGRLSRVRFWPRLCTPFSGDSPSGVRRGLSCSLTSTPPRHRFVASSSQLSRGRLPSSVSGVLWRSSGPPSAQSPFAWDGRYPPTRVTPRSPQRVLPLFLSSYGLMRQTTVLLTPR